MRKKLTIIIWLISAISLFVIVYKASSNKGFERFTSSLVIAKILALALLQSDNTNSLSAKSNQLYLTKLDSADKVRLVETSKVIMFGWDWFRISSVSGFRPQFFSPWTKPGAGKSAPKISNPEKKYLVAH